MPPNPRLRRPPLFPSRLQERELAACTFHPCTGASPPPRRRHAPGGTAGTAASTSLAPDLLEQVQALLQGAPKAAPAAVLGAGETATAALAPALGQPADAAAGPAAQGAGGSTAAPLSFAGFFDQVTAELLRMQAPA